MIPLDSLVLGARNAANQTPGLEGNLYIAAGHPARLRPGPSLHTIGQTQGGTAEVVHLDIREDQETDVLVMLPTNCGHSNIR